MVESDKSILELSVPEDASVAEAESLIEMQIMRNLRNSSARKLKNQDAIEMGFTSAEKED
jgi:hypothetical protein